MVSDVYIYADIYSCISGCMTAMQPCGPGASALHVQLPLHSVCCSCSSSWPWLSQIGPMACTGDRNAIAVQKNPNGLYQSLVW